MACLARSFHPPPVVIGASLGGVQRIFDFMNEHIEHGFGSIDEAADSRPRLRQE
jgi:hypothetical protein